MEEFNYKILKDSNDFGKWCKRVEKRRRYICKVGKHMTNKPLRYPCLIIWLIDDEDVMYDFIYKNDIKDL